MFSVLLVFLEPTFSAEEALGVSVRITPAVRHFPFLTKSDVGVQVFFSFTPICSTIFQIWKEKNALHVRERLVWDCTVPVEGILGLWWGNGVTQYFFVELIACVPFPPSAVLGFCFSAVHRWNCHHIL